MEQHSIPFRKNSIIVIVLILLLNIPANYKAQSNNNYEKKITPSAITNYRIGLYSGNSGIMKSCIYFAGKYKMKEVCYDLLNVIESSDDTELCELAIWSLYQIGNDKYCEMLKEVISNKKSVELTDLFNFLNKIRKYGNEIAVKN